MPEDGLGIAILRNAQNDGIFVAGSARSFSNCYSGSRPIRSIPLCWRTVPGICARRPPGRSGQKDSPPLTPACTRILRSASEGGRQGRQTGLLGPGLRQRTPTSETGHLRDLGSASALIRFKKTAAAGRRSLWMPTIPTSRVSTRSNSRSNARHCRPDWISPRLWCRAPGHHQTGQQVTARAGQHAGADARVHRDHHGGEAPQCARGAVERPHPR